MVAKVEITDIKKLRPELLEKSVAEIDRLITELQMAKVEKSKVEEAAKRAKQLDEAGAHFDSVLESLRWLHENNFLADSVKEFFTTSSGVFTPHLKLKKPRA